MDRHQEIFARLTKAQQWALMSFTGSVLLMLFLFLPFLLATVTGGAKLWAKWVMVIALSLFMLSWLSVRVLGVLQRLDEIEKELTE